MANSFFSAEGLSENCFVVMNGKTGDVFVDASLRFSDVRYALARYLKSQGFEGVFFMDTIRRLYALDSESARLMRGLPPERNACADATVFPSFSGRIDPGDGPFGHAIRDSVPAVPDAPELPPPAALPSEGENDGFSFGGMSIENAWEQSLSLLYNSNRRYALVLCNMQSLQYQITPRVSAFLAEMAARRTDTPCAVVFLYHTRSENDDLRYYAESGTEAWRGFYGAYLQPTGNHAENSRILRLGAPSAAETERLLLMMSHRGEAPLSVQAQDIPAISRDLAYIASARDLPLKELYRRLSGIPSGTVLTRNNWERLCGMTRLPTAPESLASLTGLDGVKEAIALWLKNAPRVSARDSRFEQSSAASGYPLHFVLSGRGGCGKRTVARIIGQLCYERGWLPQARFTELSAGALFTPAVGGTPERVREIVERSLGGVLYITHAGALRENAHAREAIDALSDAMKTYAGQISVILSDTGEKTRRLLRESEGLASRLAARLQLADLTPAEFGEILRRRAAEGENPFTMEQALLDNFCEGYVGSCRFDDDYANAATAIRLADEWRGLARDGRLTRERLPEAYRPYLLTREERLSAAMGEIQGLIGLESVKSCLGAIFNDVIIGTSPLIGGSKHWIFHGNPGTGKTYMAQKITPILQLLGVIHRNHITVVKAAELLAEENPVAALERQFADARGGVFFLDEAHQLMQSDLGQSLIRALVPMIEEPDAKADTAVILAGYSAEMRQFIRMDDGMPRRFPEPLRLLFPDYSAAELTELIAMYARRMGLVPSPGYLRRSQAALARYLEVCPAQFGNAGFIVDTFLPGSVQAHNARIARSCSPEGGILTEAQVAAMDETLRRTLSADDLPACMRSYALPVSAPVPPERTAWNAVEELVGKDEIRDYLESLRGENPDSIFCDGTALSGWHFSIAGPSGCGRRTAAAAIAGVLHLLGILESRHVTYVSKGDLEGEYVGHTAQKTRAVVDRVLGGTLVVLNPSSMVPSSSSDNQFGPDALGVLAEALSSRELSVIFVDTEEGLERLFHRFPAMRGAMTRQFRLRELSPREMEEIFRLRTAGSMVFEPEAEEMLGDFFINWVSDRGGLSEAAHSWCNAAELDILTGDLRAAWRLQKGETRMEGGYPCRVITRGMFPPRMRRYLRRTREISDAAYDTLMGLTGLHSVKNAVESLRDGFRFSRCGRSPGCYSFIGPPGTGKTMVARLMGGFLRSFGLLQVGHCVERGAQQLLASPDAFDEAFRLSVNGVLFIDEFHQLRNYAGGQVIIDKLVKLVEDEATCRDHCVIIAGYHDEMLRTLALDKGLNSRFGREDSILVFENYTPDELSEILDYMAASAAEISAFARPAPLALTPEYRALAAETFRAVCKQPDFGNARFVRNLLADSIRSQYRRFGRSYRGADEIPDGVYNTLTAEDFPERWRR